MRHLRDLRRGHRRETLQLEQRLRARGVTDERVLWALRRVPRPLFVPEVLAGEAVEDRPLPIGNAQTISQPWIVALMTEALDVRAWHSVLEIGTGSGWQAAILSQLCREIRTIERYRALAVAARERLDGLGLGNVEIRWGDGWDGWPGNLLFDRIIVTAVAERIPERLVGQLVDGGILVLPLERGVGEQELVRLVVTGGQVVERQHLCRVRFVPMRHGTVEGAANPRRR